MSMPGFTATAGLLNANRNAYASVGARRIADLVRPAQTTHQECINNCTASCRAAGSLPRQCAAECRAECAGVGNGGGGGGGGGPAPPPPPTPLPTCAAGGLCGSIQTGDTCQCPPGQTCGPVCTTTRTPVVNPVLCLLFPPWGCIPQWDVASTCSTDWFCA